MELRVCIAGATGWVGKPLCVAVSRAEDMRLVGVVAAGNFAIPAVLLQRFACEAAKYLPSWEVIDYASDAKPDAPTGTARELAYRLSEVGTPSAAHPVGETVGARESRG